MKNVKGSHILLSVIALTSVCLYTGCSFLDTKIDTELTDNHVNSNYKRLWNFGYAAYMRLSSGFSAIDENIFATVSDEAEMTHSPSNTQLFNEGSWTAINNPDDVYTSDYEGIRAANYFLQMSSNYKASLSANIDTISDNGAQYRRNVLDIEWLRAENRILRAYFYFDLIKRYGDVPFTKRVFEVSDNTNIPRTDFNTIVNFIISEIDLAKDSLQVSWKTYDNARDGRITKGMALALKSRVLLYAASPLYNKENNPTKWQAAAAAAYEVLALNQYSLDDDYQQLFIGDRSTKSSESIFAIRMGATNNFERQNYPIGTPGGNSGINPSHNLVSAYEYTGTPDIHNPYANRDPRLQYTIVVNNSNWNGRTIQIWQNGQDDFNKKNASKTGYYLKKFMSNNLNLANNESKLRSWIVFRLGEIYLNYAEAMNEAYGPDNANGYGFTAKEALNKVRDRTGVNMPPITTADQDEFRNKVKHERRIELAMEDHRYWDLKRWKDAEIVLNQPLLGVKATRNNDNTYSYNVFEVEKRVFVAPKMYFYPIPQKEISKSGGVLTQNPGW